MLPRWLITFRALALACAFAAAFVPIATYITDDKRDWLWIHIGVNIAAYIAVALTTIYTTVNLTQQDHNKFSVPAYWANNVVMRTWYLGVSKTWRWHVAAAVGRLGLALGMMRLIDGLYLPMGSDLSIFTPHIYMGIVTGKGPQLETVILALVLLIGFALVENMLLSAFAILLGFRKQYHALSIALAIALRLIIIVTFLRIMIMVDQPVIESQPTYQMIFDKTIYQRHFLEWYHVAFTWLDDGIMMSAKVMRPLESYPCLKLLTSDEENGWITCVNPSSSTPYLVVAIIQTIAAYITYIFLTFASLQLAQYLHWRREQRETPTPAPTMS